MHDFLLDWLVCPVCHSRLAWEIDARHAGRIERARAVCRRCPADYPVREGIGLFLTPDLDREDLWEAAEGGVVRAVREDPSLSHRLMDPAVESLSPADQLFRCFVHESRNEFAPAGRAASLSYAGLYSGRYRACWDSQVRFLQSALAEAPGPVVDLASGRGGLIDPLLTVMDQILVMTDFSPRVLRRNRRWLQWRGQLDQVSLLAFDARRMPFRERVLPQVTTNLGLANLRDAPHVAAEIFRVVVGRFHAVAHFYPQGDGNEQAIRASGLEHMLYLDLSLGAFRAAGFDTEFLNACTGRARPTPASEIFEGLRVDGLPVVETDLLWGVLACEREGL